MHTVARLSIAPVKGLGLVHPDRVVLGPDGVADDRRFHLVDADGRLFKSKHHGPLLRIRPDWDADAGRLALAFPDGTAVAGPVEPGAPVRTEFWGGRPVAGRVVEGPFAAALSAYAGQPLRLVCIDRPGDGNDEHPVTLLADASVAALARHAEVPGLDARRFRMLVQLAGGDPYEEDGWEGQALRVGATVVKVAGPVARCVVTRQSPETGERDVQVLDAIAAARGYGEGRKLLFGRYADVVEPGLVRVGDPVVPVAL